MDIKTIIHEHDKNFAIDAVFEDREYFYAVTFEIGVPAYAVNKQDKSIEMILPSNRKMMTAMINAKKVW